MLRSLWIAFILTVILTSTAAHVHAADTTDPITYRLYEGLTAYVNNPDGKAMSIRLDLRDINLFNFGPREVLYKIYDPDGIPVVREIIPDDGITTPAFPGRARGWADEMSYYTTLYAKGTFPSYRWSAWSEPGRLNAIAARTFIRDIPGGKPGIYRIVLAGSTDHYATLSITPDLKYGVVGHTTWIHGHHNLLKKQYIYVPKDTSGIFFSIIEPDRPLTRTFKLTAPDGKILFEGQAKGGYIRVGARAYRPSTIKFEDPTLYAGKLLTMEVSEGAGDYLLKVTLQQPKEGAFADYVGMGSLPVFCDDEATAMAIEGGTFVEDGLLFWHPFQAKMHRWLKAHPLDHNASDEDKAVRADIDKIFAGFRLLETSDGRGSAVWTNWGYAFGYYGFKIWREAWLVMKNPDVPDELKATIREGLIMAGDRLSFAMGTESVNGNAFAQIPVGLWYGHHATGDAMQKERFEVFWDRWKNEGFGPGVGLSKSGDAQEFFAHDIHYGSYIMDNWKANGNTWVRQGGILGDAGDDTRFQDVMNRYYNLYSYLYCRETTNRAVPANPWSARTHMHPHNQAQNWEHGPYTWKGEPGPDITASVNDGDEWFAARRKGYYMVSFHGRISPEWLSQTFPGQLGFGGGILCQFTIPGKGPVLASMLTDSYGTGMHPSNWRNMRLHGLMGETWDGKPLIAAISEHDRTAKLDGNTVTSSGEVRDAHIVAYRSYTYQPDGVLCSVRLEESPMVEQLSIFSWDRYWSEVKLAYEVFPYMPTDPTTKIPTSVTIRGADDSQLGDLTATPTEAKTIRIDRGGFGVEIQLEAPAIVQLGANHTVMVQIVAEGEEPTPAADVALKYRLVPFGT